MKIVSKLTTALIAGTCVILSANALLRVRRERRFLEADRIRDHEMVGRALEVAAAAVWKADGKRAAIQAIDAASTRAQDVRIEWIPLGGRAPKSPPGDLDLDRLRALPPGEPTTLAGPWEGTEDLWKTYVPLDVDGVRQGIIELSGSPGAAHRVLRNIVVDTAAMATALAIVSAALSFLMGQWLVGAPVRVLSDRARRIGRGDFSGRLELRRGDELTDLAREMNGMCDRLVTTLDQLRHADRLATVGKLASGVAHELGTPLNVVAARAAMIAAGETTPEESREYGAIIGAAANRMTATIRELLQFARRSGPEKAPCDVPKLVADTVELLRPLARRARVDLIIGRGEVGASGRGETDARANVGASGRGEAGTSGRGETGTSGRGETGTSGRGEADARANVDASQIQQVITNLVVNAIQAMPRGGKVELSVRKELAQPPAGGPDRPAGRTICLRVRDEGEGIAPENLPHIFEPFFTTKDVGAGTGLGLAVSYGIIRDHGGWIVVDSRLHAGATFSVYLPALETA